MLFPHWFTIPSHSWIIPFTEETGIFHYISPIADFGAAKKWFNTEKIVKNFIYFATIVNLACLVFPRIGINPFDLIYIETITVNHFLFIAHNAAGGFIAVLLALNIGFFSLERVNRQKGKC